MTEHLRFTSDAEPCPYLDDQIATLEYRIAEGLSGDEYDRLLEAGWRRFGCTLMRPVCEQCSECVPIRLAVEEFRPSRSQRRVLRRNSDIEIVVNEPSVTLEHVRLYIRYHTERHQTRHWPEARFDLEEYLHCFVANAAPTHEFQYRLGGELVGVGYAGESTLALNSIYAFFDPNQTRRSLGTFNILSQFEESRRRDKQYLYLGYWIRDCRSMVYKSRFRPHQLRTDENWA